MREILFRGKSIKTGIWKVGSFSRTYGTNKAQIKSLGDCCSVIVDEKTVSEFVGIVDRNGRKVFEGDIVKCRDYHGNRMGVVWMRQKGHVLYLCGFDGKSDEYLFNESDFEVIGNRWDNPEVIW